MFINNSTLGTLPKTVLFTSTSSGSPTTYLWKVNNVVFGSNSNSATYTFTNTGHYNVCLTVSNANCSSVYCHEFDFPEDCICCYIPNYDFETLFNPVVPDNELSSSEFNSTVCGWYQAESSPYYCYYPDKSYIAILLNSSVNEIARTNIALTGMVNGHIYEGIIRYSVQQRGVIGNSLPPNHPNIIGGPSNVFIQKSNGSGQSSVIFNKSNPPLNAPSTNGSYMNSNDYDCIDPGEIQWVQESFLLTYDSNFPYISITGQSSSVSGRINYLLVDELSFICPASCGDQPIFTANVNGCNATLNQVNLGGGGNLTYDYGDGTSGSSNTHTYLYPGTFNVCATRTCDDFTFATYCKEVTISNLGCNISCTTLSAITSVKCSPTGSPSSSYLGQVTVTVPTGYKPCGGTPALSSSNLTTSVTANSYTVTSPNSGSDIITLSFNIIPASGSNFPASPTNISFALCNGSNIICFTVPVTGQECTTCDVINLTATCNQSLSQNGTFVYQGSLTGINGIPSQIISTAAGFSVNGNNFSITSNSSITGSVSSILTFGFFPNISCYKLNIIVIPCTPQPTQCDHEWQPKYFYCTKPSPSSGPVFNLGNMSVPTYGLKLCSNGLVGSIDGGGSVTVNSASTYGAYFNFDLSISMPPGAYNGSQNFDLRLFFCDDRGNVVCYLFKLKFFCYEDPNGGPRTRVEKTEDDISFYPNPSNNFVTFKLNQKDNIIAKIAVQDQMGRIVFDVDNYNDEMIIDVSTWSEGVYFANILDKNNKKRITRFVVIK